MDLRALGRLNGNWSLLLLRLGVAPGLRGPLGWAQGGLKVVVLKFRFAGRKQSRVSVWQQGRA